MKTSLIGNAKTFQKTGKFTLTTHAKERIRQRVGIEALDAQVAWANETIAKAGEIDAKLEGRVGYKTESFEIICAGLKVITVNPVANSQTYLTKLSGVLTKEVRKMIVPHERLLRKAEIRVAELTLNYLKARNPKTKRMINERLVEATDEKQRLTDEVYAMRKAAERYGVEV